ncbi:MAG: metal ABC transporter substrate-binding protein [Nitriliruptoraceae bacterium]
MHRTHPRPPRQRTWLGAAAVGLVLTACGAPTEADLAAETDGGEQLHIVATTSILGDIVGALAEDDAEVSVIMPPASDPHGFQPSARDARLLREADLVVANGLQLEESLISSLESAEEEGVRVFTVADKVDPLAFEGDDHADDEHADGEHADDEHADDDHGHGEEDPHFWLDPVRTADGVELLGAELASVDGAPGRPDWTARAAAYAEELRAVESEMATEFERIPTDRRKLVTNHDALAYLADRFDFEIIGTVIPGTSTQAEPDPRAFGELVETLERESVSVVFVETTDSTALAEQLDRELAGRGLIDLAVVTLHTGGLGEAGSGAETYVDLLRTNARLIADALSADG